MVTILSVIILIMAGIIVFLIGMLASKQNKENLDLYKEIINYKTPSWNDDSTWSISVPSEEQKYKELSGALDEAIEAVRQYKLQIPPEKDE
ncbi:hypothetical protein PR1_22 [Providencia phage vB_PreS_PR1]|uniref:Uncharacterized protein n=2 Tax=Priunavirus TaxID=2560210 RepID=A0A873WHW2_9CAUD|nr:hypothetical protein FDH30_gp022 [Providencia phage vB_PreS_PR1]YP_010113960.1 hypothetical protein KNV68_gp075 [Providencia phage PSTCR5]AQT25339.2 hypothetical protein PR1_22 [Providencia phage vB_PreS_PR1]QPB12173.1 hypothetical protein [Providencia phage PSTCR5]